MTQEELINKMEDIAFESMGMSIGRCLLENYLKKAENHEEIEEPEEPVYEYLWYYPVGNNFGLSNFETEPYADDWVKIKESKREKKWQQ